MSDRDLVTALRAGDRLAAGQVYDVYGTRLYAYCHELLADPRLAADALRDTFIVAAKRIHDLAEADEFGAWLYALARAECGRVGISDDAPADAASAARGDRLARLALDVYSMLEPDARELLDLAFRHRLVDADLALVLRKDEASDRRRGGPAPSPTFETALLVVLAARTGDPRCVEAAEFGQKFDEIDGKGIPAWLQAARKHVEKLRDMRRRDTQPPSASGCSRNCRTRSCRLACAPGCSRRCATRRARRSRSRSSSAPESSTRDGFPTGGRRRRFSSGEEVGAALGGIARGGPGVFRRTGHVHHERSPGGLRGRDQTASVTSGSPTATFGDLQPADGER